MHSEIVGIHYFNNIYQLFQIVKFHYHYISLFLPRCVIYYFQSREHQRDAKKRGH